MITLDDIIINENTYKDILKTVYSGSDYTSDSKKLSLLRSRIKKYNKLSLEQKLKTKNDFIILSNVFDMKQVVRFFLSNMDKEYWPVILSILFSTGSLEPMYPNVYGENVVSSKYINKDIVMELL